MLSGRNSARHCPARDRLKGTPMCTIPGSPPLAHHFTHPPIRQQISHPCSQSLIIIVSNSISPLYFIRSSIIIIARYTTPDHVRTNPIERVMLQIFCRYQSIVDESSLNEFRTRRQDTVDSTEARSSRIGRKTKKPQRTGE